MTSEHTEAGPELDGTNEAGKPSRVTLDSRFVLAFLLVSGTVLMLVYHLVWTNGDFSKLIHGDERAAYYPAALGIKEEGLSWFLKPRVLWVGPGNPTWIALLGARIGLVKLANVGLFVISGILVWDLARRMFGDLTALLSVATFVVFIPFYQFLPTLLTEPVFIFLLIAGVWGIVIVDANSTWGPIAAGLVLGIATLTRPTLQLFPLFLIGAWLVLTGVCSLVESEGITSRRALRSVRSAGPRVDWIRSVSIRPLLLLALGVAIVVLPYLAKNVVAVDRFAIANGSGAVLYLGNDLRKNGDEPAYSHMTFDTVEITTPFRHRDTEGDRRLTSAAIDSIRQNAFDVLLLQPEKAARLVFGSKYHYFWPQDNVISFVESTSWFKRLRIWDMVLKVSVAVFGLVGLVILPIKPMARLVFGSLIVYFIAVHTVLFPIPRLVLPIFPFLMILAGGVFVQASRVVKLGLAIVAISIIGFISFEGVFASPGVTHHYTTYFDPVVEVDLDEQIAGTHDVRSMGDGSFETTGDDPYLVIEVPPFEAALNQVVFATMTSVVAPGHDESGVGQMFWREVDGTFDEEHSILFDIESDGNERIYRISPTGSKREQWLGTKVAALRLDLPHSQDGFTFQLADVEVKK